VRCPFVAASRPTREPLLLLGDHPWAPAIRRFPAQGYSTRWQ